MGSDRTGTIQTSINDVQLTLVLSVGMVVRVVVLFLRSWSSTNIAGTDTAFRRTRALLVLKLTGTDLTLIAFIGIILLIGIVKKNGIMLVDHALDLQRRMALPPHEAIIKAGAECFRPILMTTLAAALAHCLFGLARGRARSCAGCWV